MEINLDFEAAIRDMLEGGKFIITDDGRITMRKD